MLARLGVIALVFGLTLVTGLQAQENETEPEIDPEAAQEQPAKQPPIEPAPVEPSLTTPTDEPRPEHDGGSTEDGDDNPQQDPNIIFGDGWAQWAMVATSVLALGVSAWAVWLLKDTLKATRQAVRAADDAVEVQEKFGRLHTKGYLSLDRVNFTFRYRGNDIVQVAAQIHVANFGNTPVRIISHQEACFMTKSPDEVEAVWEKASVEEKFTSVAKGQSYFIHCGAVDWQDALEAEESEKFFVARGRLGFTDIFSTEEHVRMRYINYFIRITPEPSFSSMNVNNLGTATFTPLKHNRPNDEA